MCSLMRLHACGNMDQANVLLFFLYVRQEVIAEDIEANDHS